MAGAGTGGVPSEGGTPSGHNIGGTPTGFAGTPGDFGDDARGGASSPLPGGISVAMEGGMAQGPGGVTTPNTPSGTTSTADETMNPGSLGTTSDPTALPTTGGTMTDENGAVTSVSSGCDCDTTQSRHERSWILLGLGIYLGRRKRWHASRD